MLRQESLDEVRLALILAFTIAGTWRTDQIRFETLSHRSTKVLLCRTGGCRKLLNFAPVTLPANIALENVSCALSVAALNISPNGADNHLVTAYGN